MRFDGPRSVGLLLQRGRPSLVAHMLSRWRYGGISRHSLQRIHGLRVRWNSSTPILLATEKYRDIMHVIFGAIQDNTTYTDKVKAELIDPPSWRAYAKSFRRKLMTSSENVLGNDNTQKLIELLDRVVEAHPVVEKPIPKISDSSYITQAADFVFDKVLSTAREELQDLINTNRTLENSKHLTDPPHEWYPRARIMKRKVFYHGGPTNSGKTYHAIQRLKAASPEYGGGIYCGPLRLLALEIYDTLNRAGIGCDLLTGQERRLMPGSTHVSSTVEMVDVNRDYDVAVIDEIQMISDPDRAHSWTRALLGLRAREIHVCGGLEAAELVQSLCETTQDVFELVKYERLSELRIEEESLRGDYTKVQPGDCIVAFSVAEIFSIRKKIEESTNMKCAVIYGKLPPETRTAQARLFNDENSGYDILVASDAIGMGLNLNIGRIIFHNTIKLVDSFGGRDFLEPTYIKQIAGRAGRKSSKYDFGRVTAWQEADLAYVRAVMDYDIPSIRAAGLFPSPDQLERFVHQLHEAQGISIEEGNNSDSTAATSSDEKKIPYYKIHLSPIVERYLHLLKVDQRYFICNIDSFVTLVNWLHTIPLSFEDRFIFSVAPTNLKSQRVMRILYDFAALYACGRPVPVGLRLRRALPTTLEGFLDLIESHNILELYIWLSNRFPKHFIEKDACIEMKNYALKQIEHCLPSHSLQAASSIETKYLSSRGIKDGKSSTETELLPPQKYGEGIRNSYIKYLSAVPKDLHYVTVVHSPTDGTKTEISGPLGRYHGVHSPKSHLHDASKGVAATLDSFHKKQTAHQVADIMLNSS